jgi:flavin reductase (DIM6/NTAB) family NADH-FMN oxidoreductase RutF
MDEDGKPNVCTVAWNTRIARKIVLIAVWQKNYTEKLLRLYGDFVINVPDVKILKAVHFCGRYSGRDVNKFEATGLTPLPAKKVRGVLINECIVNVECKGIGSLNLPLVDHTLFIGEIVAVHVDPEYYNDETGYLEFEKSDLLIEGSDYSYLKVGDEVALQELPRGVTVKFKDKYKHYDIKIPIKK